MDIVIIGAGGIGGFVGGMLSRGGHEVTLVDQWYEHICEIQKNGLKIKTQSEKLLAKPRALHISELQQECRVFDAAFIAVKSYDTEWATMLIKNYIKKEEGFFVDFQNGINDERVASIVGAEKALGCVVSIGAACYEPGEVIRTDDYPLGFKIGEHDGSKSERATRIVEMLNYIADSKVTTDLWGDRWSKLMLNCMTNALAGLTGYSTSEVRTIAAARRVGIQLGAEVARVAMALGHKLQPISGVDPEEVINAAEGKNIEVLEHAMLEAARRAGTDARPSFGQDVLKKRRTEIEFLNGYVSQKGREINIPTPFNDTIVKIVLGLGIGFSADPTNIDELIGMLPY